MPQDKCARVEDWNSDEDSAVPGTLQAAQTGRRPAQPSSRSQKPVARSQSRAPAPPASDSGYSSHASAPQATTKSPVPPRGVNPSARAAVQPPVVASPTKSSKSKPQIHRIDSARSTRAQTVSSPAPQDTRRCSDPNCNDPNCGGSTNTERRYILPERQQSRPQPQSQQHPSYSATPTYSQPPYPQYAQAAPMQAPPPPPNMMAPPGVPRQRSGSMSRARPVSIHGYNSMSYNGAQAGPPPSASAYYAYNQPPGYPPQTSAYAGAMGPPAAMDYPPASPILPASPSSPPVGSFGDFPAFPGQYSARRGNPNVPGLEMPKPMPRPGLGLQRTVSARNNERPAARRSSYIEPREPAEYSESATESDSEAESEYAREYRRDSRRDSRAMATTVVPTRRPSTNKKYLSESAVPRVRRESREVTRVRTSPDNLLDYPSSSDFGDSDRTAKAVIHRARDARDGRDSERGSRRQSVSSKGSSTRTKPSSLSSVTDYSRVIVEGLNGRRTAYLSKEQQANLIRQYQQQKLEDKLEQRRQEDCMRQENIEDYQKSISGQAYELTAENMKKHSDRKTTSRVSGRSQKSSNSGSKMSKSDGIKIESGGTVLHVYGDAKIEMRASEDGGPAHFVIGSSTGKESSYLASSKGSSNGRLGRSRSRREPIPEDPYEPGY